MATPAILGGDDWAMRRGHTYGTRLGDLERHRPIDLLPDRTADTLAAWLRAHPGGTILSRDRSMEDARGAIQGAPAAQHVLDRWHLVRHLREALERLRDRWPRRVAATLTASHSASAPTISMEARALRRSTTDQMARQARRARRVARDEKVQARHAQGVSKRHMAKTLPLSRTTVIRARRPTVCPERAHSRRVSRLDPSVASLHKRWEEGCRHGVQLWREIQALGFAGTRRMVSTWVVRRRELWRGRPSAAGRRPALPKEPAARLLPAPAEGMSRHLPAPRQLVWLL
jgi:transposase